MEKVFIKLLMVAFLLVIPVTLVAQQSNSIFDTVRASVTYTADIFANTTGGFDTGLRYFDNLD